MVNKFIAYLDILGFSAAINDDKDDTEFALAQLIRELQNENKKGLCVPVGKDEKTTGLRFSNHILSISDSIIIVNPDVEKAERSPPLLLQFISVVTDIAKLATLLLRKGYLVRGAMAYGNYNQQGMSGFGRAHVEAVKAEESVSIYPRVILCSSVVSLCKDNADISGMVRGNTLIDSDGMRYIHWLNWCGLLQELMPLDLVCNTINQALENKSNLKVYSKWAWMANYINNNVEQYLVSYNSRVKEEDRIKISNAGFSKLNIDVLP